MDLLTFLIILAVIATGGALATGVISMVQGGYSDEKLSTPLMWARVGLQGAAFALLLLALTIAVM